MLSHGGSSDKRLLTATRTTKCFNSTKVDLKSQRLFEKASLLRGRLWADLAALVVCGAQRTAPRTPPLLAPADSRPRLPMRPPRDAEPFQTASQTWKENAVCLKEASPKRRSYTNSIRQLG